MLQPSLCHNEGKYQAWYSYCVVLLLNNKWLCSLSEMSMGERVDEVYAARMTFSGSILPIVAPFFIHTPFFQPAKKIVVCINGT